MELIFVLLTGLTTGGLTCLAVQGGLLASVTSARAAAATSARPVSVTQPVVEQRTSNAAKKRQHQTAIQQDRPQPNSL